MQFEASVEGLDDLVDQLAALDEVANYAAKRGLYDGAGVVADAVHASIRSLDTEPFYFATEQNPRKCSPQEKAVLDLGIGITSIYSEGGWVVRTAVGLSHSRYVDVAGKRVALAVIARSVNSGTSFRVKQPFFRHAVTKARSKANEAIVAEIKRTLENATKK